MPKFIVHYCCRNLAYLIEHHTVVEQSEKLIIATFQFLGIHFIFSIIIKQIDGKK